MQECFWLKGKTGFQSKVLCYHFVQCLKKWNWYSKTLLEENFRTYDWELFQEHSTPLAEGTIPLNMDVRNLYVGHTSSENTKWQQLITLYWYLKPLKDISYKSPMGYIACDFLRNHSINWTEFSRNPFFEKKKSFESNIQK